MPASCIVQCTAPWQPPATPPPPTPGLHVHCAAVLPALRDTLGPHLCVHHSARAAASDAAQRQPRQVGSRTCPECTPVISPAIAVATQTHTSHRPTHTHSSSIHHHCHTLRKVPRSRAAARWVRGSRRRLSGQLLHSRAHVCRCALPVCCEGQALIRASLPHAPPLRLRPRAARAPEPGRRGGRPSRGCAAPLPAAGEHPVPG